MADFNSRRRRSRDAARVADPGDRPGALRIGAADERLEALLEEERESRAASVPVRTAAVRRLAAAPGQATQATASSSVEKTKQGAGRSNHGPRVWGRAGHDRVGTGIAGLGSTVAGSAAKGIWRQSSRAGSFSSTFTSPRSRTPSRKCF